MLAPSARRRPADQRAQEGGGRSHPVSVARGARGANCKRDAWLGRKVTSPPWASPSRSYWASSQARTSRSWWGLCGRARRAAGLRAALGAAACRRWHRGGDGRPGYARPRWCGAQPWLSTPSGWRSVERAALVRAGRREGVAARAGLVGVVVAVAARQRAGDGGDAGAGRDDRRCRPRRRSRRSCCA